MTKTHWFEGSNVAEAIAKAESALKISRDRMEIEVINKGSRGFLGFGRAPAVIKVKMIDQERDGIDDDERVLEALVLDLAREATEDRDGLVGVKDGTIVVIPPRGNGRYPTVAPCPQIKLRINGITHTKRTVVTDKDEIVCEVIAPEDQRLYEIEISKDGLCAYLTVYPPVRKVRRLRDAEPAAELELAVEEFEEPLRPLSVDEVLQALREKGVVYGVDEEKVRTAVLKANGLRVAVAFGRPAVPSKDGYLDLVYERHTDTTAAKDEQKVDFRELNIFESVKAGEVVARIVEPVQGQPGMTVTGKEIEVKLPRAAHFRVGKGVRQVDDRLVATISGRPKVTGNLVEVLPLLLIEGDVDISTGNIRFSGDVLIKGNVTSGMTVSAEGMIKVLGIVEKARVTARDGVVCLDSVVNSRVQAGGETAELSKVLPMAKRILHDLEIVEDAVCQINLRLQWRGKQPVAAGRIVEVLLERKLRDLPRMAKELLEVCEEKGLSLEETEVNMFKSITNMVLHPVSSVAVPGNHNVSELVNNLKDWISNAESRMKRKSEVYLRYALNSEVYATGSITVDGQGCFNTLLSSAERVTVKGTPGVFRGGQIIAANDVYVRELGSEVGALTRVNVTENRRVVCERVLGNVLIGIGRHSVRIDEPREGLVVWMDEERRIRMR
ncbi:MAG TPA: FapA family protein [Syntrophothermus lipocalidus]|nr:FapA family protein [Syntrophothermus lipocalidus]